MKIGTQFKKEKLEIYKDVQWHVGRILMNLYYNDEVKLIMHKRETPICMKRSWFTIYKYRLD